MGYPRVTYLQQCMYLIKRKLMDLLDIHREDPAEPTFSRLPDGTILVTYREKEKQHDRK